MIALTVEISTLTSRAIFLRMTNRNKSLDSLLEMSEDFRVPDQMVRNAFVLTFMRNDVAESCVMALCFKCFILWFPQCLFQLFVNFHGQLF